MAKPPLSSPRAALARSIKLALAASFALLAAGACASAPPPPPPAPPKAKRACLTWQDAARPYAFALDADDRRRLAEAASKGVVVVKHSCEGLEILDRCTAHGHYGTLSVEGQDPLDVSLDTEAELDANAPARSNDHRALTAPMTATFTRLERRRTVHNRLSVDALSGACQGATHFVKGIDQGALTISERGKPPRSTGGEAGCSAQGGAVVAGQCAVPISLELTMLDPPGEHGGALTELSQRTRVRFGAECPHGWVHTNRRCVPYAEGRPYACGTDAESCQTQCEAGDAESCSNLGVALETQSGPGNTPDRVAQLYRTACEGGSMWGCTNFAAHRLAQSPDGEPGMVFMCDRGEPYACLHLSFLHGRRNKSVESALKSARRACQGGLAQACHRVAELLESDRAARIEADDLLDQACSAGYEPSCLLAAKHDEGALPPRPSLEHHRRACALRASGSCTKVANQLPEGTPDRDRVAYLERACATGDGEGCFGLATRTLAGQGLPADAAKGKLLLHSACYRNGFQKACDAYRKLNTEAAP